MNIFDRGVYKVIVISARWLNSLCHLNYLFWRSNNPNSIGVKYSLIVLGGGFLHRVSVLTSLLVKRYFLATFFG